MQPLSKPLCSLLTEYSGPPPDTRGGDDDNSRNPGSNLFVTGIHPSLTEEEVSRLFEKYGEVEKCNIMKDPHTKESRGFGFVKMVTSDQADAAKEGLQGEVHQGRTLSIEKARRARPRTPTPGKYYGPPKRGKLSPEPWNARANPWQSLVDAVDVEVLLATATAMTTVAVEVTMVEAEVAAEAAAVMMMAMAIGDPATRTVPIAVSERTTARVESIAMPLVMIVMAAMSDVVEVEEDTTMSVLRRLPLAVARAATETLPPLARKRTVVAVRTRTVVMINAILVRPSLTLPEPKRF